ncbi:hypothetical protein Mahau_0079 [Mahella australiensis 50-1 BON]|uniref:Uncharacterized protein n=1 Tax=Mahella australiensis (strain DSM 15567 / CIP 107919 / 50-1 BON) TaxID=697281 RepID=F3ZVF2_MAHA5|nr:hypothetical protein Mahau_0079 [Mahella australiensis 50-1 BON]
MSLPIKKNYLRRNRFNIITMVVLILLLIIGFYYNCINIHYDLENNDHFNILTINSILAGFLFTGLGILSSALDKPRIERLDKNGYLDDYFNGIYIGIMMHVLSMMASIFIIMSILGQYKNVFLYIEQIGLIIGTIFFVKSILRLFSIIKRMRNS